MIILKKINFEYLEKCNYEEAKKNICLIPGIGNKVADCIIIIFIKQVRSISIRYMDD